MAEPLTPLEQRLRERTAGSLDALMQRLPHSVDRQLADGRFEPVAVRRLRVGDVIRVRPGEAFAADGVLVSGQSHVDESLLTGESRPLPRAVGDMVLAGSHNLSAPVLVRVLELGEGVALHILLVTGTHQAQAAGPLGFFGERSLAGAQGQQFHHLQALHHEAALGGERAGFEHAPADHPIDQAGAELGNLAADIGFHVIAEQGAAAFRVAQADLRAAFGDTKARHDFIKNQHAAVFFT